MSNDPKWFFADHEDAERWSGPHDTREEALAEAFAEDSEREGVCSASRAAGFMSDGRWQKQAEKNQDRRNDALRELAKVREELRVAKEQLALAEDRVTALGRITADERQARDQFSESADAEHALNERLIRENEELKKQLSAEREGRETGDDPDYAMVDVTAATLETVTLPAVPTDPRLRAIEAVLTARTWRDGNREIARRILAEIDRLEKT